MDELKQKYSPFHCGTQCIDWMGCNCERCKKFSGYDSDINTIPCEIEKAIIWASVDDGTISKEIYDRMDANNGNYVWKCPEVDWTDEWMAECLAKEVKHG
jgi:hypothetical protein